MSVCQEASTDVGSGILGWIHTICLSLCCCNKLSQPGQFKSNTNIFLKFWRLESLNSECPAPVCNKKLVSTSAFARQQESWASQVKSVEGQVSTFLDPKLFCVNASHVHEGRVLMTWSSPKGGTSQYPALLNTNMIMGGTLSFKP